MATECRPDSFDFGTVAGRAVVGAFDGGVISSDAGALLLGATDTALSDDLVGPSGNPGRLHLSFQQFPGYQHVLFRCKQIFNLVPIAVTSAVWTGISWRIDARQVWSGDGGSVDPPSYRAWGPLGTGRRPAEGAAYDQDQRLRWALAR